MLFTGSSAAGTFKTLHEFTGNQGFNPQGGLVFDKAGNLYGTTIGGGPDGNGTVFKLSPNADGTWTESTIHVFAGKSGGDGSGPTGGLVFDTAGNLYGTTGRGGTSNVGTVFKLSPNSDGTWTETVLTSFPADNDPQFPGGVILDAAGNLYGAAELGGRYDYGAVFELSPNSDGTWTETVLYSFNEYGADASANPEGRLTFDAAGDLYGTAVDCIIKCYGTVFKLRRDSDGTWTPTVIHAFTGGRDGSRPTGDLIFDAAGNLYGLTQNGGHPSCPPSAPANPSVCGKVFKLTPNSNGTCTESVPHLFSTEANVIGITFDATGNLYGTTFDGGFDDYGRVYELTPQSGGGWAYSVPRYFYGKPDENPNGPVVFDKAGNLYGTTAQCPSGYNCNGAIYEITP
jgi:uncharacterized repeat protein (TIGR03803 family)